MKVQKSILQTVHANEARLKNQQFSDLSEIFLQSPPSLFLRGPIYLVFLILIAAIAYSSVTSVSIKVSSYLTVKGEEYIVQSPANGTVNVIYQADNNNVGINERLLAIYSQTAFSKETNLSQISHSRAELQNKYRWLAMFQTKLDALTAEYARKNSAFDLKLPEHKPANSRLKKVTRFTAADTLELQGGGEFGLKYSNLRQNIDLLSQEYDRTVRTHAQLAVTYKENQRLLDKRFISRQEFLSSEQAYSQAKSGLETIATNLRAALLSAYQETYRGMEAVEAELDQLERETETITHMLAGIEISGNSLILKNRYPGVITDIYVKTSQMVSEGMPLLRIIRNDYPLIGVIPLPVSQIGQVKTGQKVAIRFDAFPFQIFGVQEGEIISISDDVRAVEGFGYAYELTVAFKNNPEIKLKPGMGGIAEIITGEKRILEIALAPMAKVFAYLRGEK